MTTALLPNYARVDLAFERGEGAYLFTADGRRFLDFLSGIAVNSLGYSHPHLLACVKAQLDKVWHTSNVFRIPGQEMLADRLVANSFADKAFFCNSGAEALEAAIKFTRRYHFKNGHPERNRIITFAGAFHGRTLATISAGGQEKYMEGFAPRVDGFDQVAFGNLNELRAAITPETGGLLIEPVQGEGGVRAADLEFLKAMRTVCDEFGLLLLVDEVQCGMGRTGKLFAHEWAEIRPDIMALAKGLGGGFPIGACLATDAVAAVMTPGTHGTTFGGNPLAMAAANAVLDVLLAPGFEAELLRVAGRLWDGLHRLQADYPHYLLELRGAGLMVGVRLDIPNTELVARLRDAGMIAGTAGDNVLRLLPPLVIGDAEVDLALETLRRVLAAWAS